MALICEDVHIGERVVICTGVVVHDLVVVFDGAIVQAWTTINKRATIGKGAIIRWRTIVEEGATFTEEKWRTALNVAISWTGYIFLASTPLGSGRNKKRLLRLKHG
jgi:UDP-3-O-[3-hydroxymyristoyl] glucosamine N-acyltransferase